MKYSIIITILLLLAGVTAANDVIFIQSVVPGGPAANAGLKVDDHVISFDGRELTAWNDLKAILAAHEPGDTVPLTVRRGDETVDLELTLGAKPGGGVALGITAGIGPDPGTRADREAATAECLGWIDTTYKIEKALQVLGFEPESSYASLRACVTGDTGQMPPKTAVGACDSVFKVHCGGLELLAEIGEARADRCEAHLAAFWGLDPSRHKAWTQCAKHKIFDRTSEGGELVDDETCLEIFRDECGADVGEAAPSKES